MTALCNSMRTATEPLESQLQHFRAEHTQQRFTRDGSPQLEQQLADLCDQILTGVQALLPGNRLEALVLGGGYGRGEGGVLQTDSGDEPYNDLEFYVFLRGNRILNERRFRKSLNDFGDQLSPSAGLHVEFKVDSLARLRRSPVTMFSYDLVSGHRILFAPEGDFSGCEHHLDASRIPLCEAARLLFNRCTGLLLVKEMLRENELTLEQSDFIGRNLAKAQLALGDVLLTAQGQYHWSCVERNRRLMQLTDFEKLPWLTELKAHHSAGAEFKLHPRRIVKSARQFLSEHLEISNLARQLWLWLESKRLHQHFGSARDYALSPIRKCPECGAPRNLFVNLRTFGPQSAFDPGAFRYPRERLLNALPLLLWEEPLEDLHLTRQLQNLLRTSASDWQSFVAAYKSVWPSFS